MRRRADVRYLPCLRRGDSSRPPQANPGGRGGNARHHRGGAEAEQPAQLPAPGDAGARGLGCSLTPDAKIMASGVVIVGTGQAGFQTAAALRSGGYDGPVTLIGEEPHIPYQRPPLSKGFPAGKQEAHNLFLRTASFYAANSID